MVDPLVETKLAQPRPRREAVPRPRLDALLSRVAGVPVTVVSAPAGFGKTTLLSSWLAAADLPVAWVALDARDRRPGRFWSYVLTALDRAVPGSAAAALTLLGSGQAAVETVLAGVVNELSVSDDDLVLVLDDYHLADGPEIAETMTFLVEHLPPQLHLVISTRADPGLPLSRLRARGALLEVRAADLRFDGHEVAAYLNDLHALGLPADAVAALEERTEGWAAALQLAVLSLRGRTDTAGFIDRFAGDDRFVVDYLVDEVLDRQPADVRRFLLDTSILERLTAPLCDVVLGGAPGEGRSMLDLLDRQNLFLVPLDDHRRWYRYHHLFGEVLRAHLGNERPGDAAELHRRASRWHADDGEVEEAVRHALAAGDTSTAADLVESSIPELRRLRREDVIRRWVDDLPDDVLANRPALAMGLVGGLMASNDFAGVEERIRAVEAMLARPEDELVVVDRAEFRRVPAAIEMYRGALALVAGDPETGVLRARRAIGTAPADDDLTPAAAAGISGLASWTMGDVVAAQASYVAAAAGLARAGHVADVLGCSLAIADMELTLGRLDAAEASLRSALELAEQHPPGGGGVLRGTADMLVALSRVAWHRDDMVEAAELLRRADDLGEGAGLPQNPYRWRVALARVRAAERDWAGALELLDEATRVYVGDYLPPVHPLHATRARLLAASGDLDGALAWAHEHRVAASDALSYLQEYEHVTLARVLLAQHRAGGDEGVLGNVTALLDRLLDAAEAGARTGTVVEVEVLRALALHAAGGVDDALVALGRAVDLAEPQRWRRFLLEPGPGLGELLETLARDRPRSPFLRDLLARRASAASATTPVAAPVPSPAERLIDPLSDRELDVLRLLASDLDGPGIARELVVSLNTVRTHTKHVYTKLGVNSRRAAVSRAHQLGLLSRSAR
ncbi:LuxR C-terminal-related transcriptional regulator [Nocardioides sp.]|uniref:LuxR C-terminal-related transcriptional regulator n=1 Tax=Nocardioides sp. TaxID=35761 RepID=UPI0025CF0C24|nr:LuxR C-terminal-related transcriptional regulator [Nocardioides sp.]